MAKIITFPSGALLLPNRSSVRIPKRKLFPPPEWLLCGAFFSLAGGTMAGLSGTLFLTIAWLGGDHGSSLGSTLLLSTIPALLMGGCCLDWYEDRIHIRHK